MASLQHYLATVSEDTVRLEQYAAARLNPQLSIGRPVIAVDTDLPWDGRVLITVEESPTADWELGLRVPSWCIGLRPMINGEPQPRSTPDPDGYLRLRRAWSSGDTVELIMDLTPRLIAGHPMIDAVRGCVAVQRGPLVYCFEAADQTTGVDVERLADARLAHRFAESREMVR